MPEVILDCTKCEKQWICCRCFRVELDDEEADKYSNQPALRERKDVKVVAQHSGHCVYFDPFSRKCKIWNTRPRVCQEYDCAKDPRVEEIIARDVLPPLPRAGQKFRIAISVVALDEKDKRRVSPMMVYSSAGPTACETFEVRGTGGQELVERAKKMVEMQIRQQLGSAFQEGQPSEASSTSETPSLPR